MNLKDVQSELRRAIKAAGGLSAWAARTRVSEAYIRMILAGDRSAPGPLILEPLGLEAVTVYRRKTNGS